MTRRRSKPVLYRVSKPKDEASEAASKRELLTSTLVSKNWGELQEQVIPLSWANPDTKLSGPDVVKWMKRMFYAGGKTLLDNLIYTDTLDDKDCCPACGGSVATTSDVNRIDAIQAELNAFLYAEQQIVQ